MARPQKVVPFAALPRGPDRDAVLVDLRHPQRVRSEIVLAPEVETRVERVVEESRNQGNLARHGLAPRPTLCSWGHLVAARLCAEILAGELGLDLLHVRFDAIVSSYLGETANNLRRVFQ